jgi:hypothetical protein
MLKKYLKYFLIFDLVLLLTALWRSDMLPLPSDLNPILLREPVQTQVTQAAFSTTSNNINYTIQPLHEYDLVGLVVSKHDTNTWWDYIHKEWNDSLNIVDLCVVWGNNVRNGAYTAINFSSGQFTCNFSTDSHEAFAAFDQSAISNNHLLTDQPGIAKKLRSVRVGDQIHFRGHLVEYSHNHGFAFKRGTSIVRTDTGNGACETVLIDSFDILKAGGKPWHILTWIAIAMLLLGVVAWFSQPVSFND